MKPTKSEIRSGQEVQYVPGIQVVHRKMQHPFNPMQFTHFSHHKIDDSKSSICFFLLTQRLHLGSAEPYFPRYSPGMAETAVSTNLLHY